jgi:hypothetical protein
LGWERSFGDVKSASREVNALHYRGARRRSCREPSKRQGQGHAGRPNLILRERTKTDDESLPAEAFQAAVAKAREFGWIV